MTDTLGMQVAKAFKLNPNIHPDLARYMERSEHIHALLKANVGLSFPRGESKALQNVSDALLMGIDSHGKLLDKAVKDAMFAVSRPDYAAAAAFVDSDEVRKLVTTYESMVGRELTALSEAVQEELSQKARALTMIERADFLRLEYTRLSPGATQLEVAEGHLTAAREALGGLFLTEALSQADSAMKALETIADPVRALTDSDGDAEQIAEIKRVRRTILSSPLPDAQKKMVLDLVADAVVEIKKPNNVAEAEKAIGFAQAGYVIAMANLRDDRAKFLGLVDTGKDLLNKLQPIAETELFLGLRVEFEILLESSLAPTSQDLTDLQALLGRMQDALDTAFKTYESVAANLKKLDGYETSIHDLQKRQSALNPTLVFPVDPEDLINDYRNLTDKVHNRVARAGEVETVVQQLIDGRLEDTAAIDAYESIKAATETEHGKVVVAHEALGDAIEKLIGELKANEIEVEELSSPPEGSLQYIQQQRESFWDSWKAKVSSAWKTKTIDAAPTVKLLTDLKDALALIPIVKLGEDTLVGTESARYRLAHEKALDLVTKAVVVQRPTDTQPVDALSAISKIDVRFKGADTAEVIKGLAEEQETQAGVLERYITAQENAVAALQKSISDKLDEATDLLNAVVKAKKGGGGKKKRHAEQEYAKFLLAQQIPELALFIEAELFSILEGARDRADKLLKDARSIHSLVVDGGDPSSFEGVTFEAVTEKLELVRGKLKNKHLKEHRKEALAKFTETYTELKGKAFERPTSETLADLDSLLDPAEGIPKAINEAVLDGKHKKDFKKEASELKSWLKKNKKKFTQKFKDKDFLPEEDPDAPKPTGRKRSGGGPPPKPQAPLKAKDGTGYLQDLVDRLKGLETMAKKQEGMVGEALEKLRELKAEAETNAGDQKAIVKKMRSLQQLEEDKEAHRKEFEQEHLAAHTEAMDDLKKDTAGRSDRKKHKEEVERDFKLAKQVFEASGKLEDARHMLLNGKEKAAFYGLGGAESKARYARKDLAKHAGEWVINLNQFNGAVSTALVNIKAAVDKDGGLELTDLGERRIVEVRARLTNLFDPKAFDAATSQLGELSSSDDKRQARSVREKGLQTARSYMDVIDNDPDILLLDMSPAGGFAHASALLKRTLMMIERTMLVSVPHGE